MTKYIKRVDGEEFLIDCKELEILRLACCDCGLVHSFDFHIHRGGKLSIATRREERATAQLRRHSYGSLQRGKSGKYMMIKGEW